MDFIEFIITFTIIVACSTILSIIFIILNVIRREQMQQEQRKRICKDIYDGAFIESVDFEKRWIISSGRGKKGAKNGFKYQDGPGCYVITIYNNPILDGTWNNYENIYIGQSIRVCERVHNHFNGKGNGDVYADIKYGKYVYVRFVRCQEKDMNIVEKKLIDAFNATNSYNKTKGGSNKRNK